MDAILATAATRRDAILESKVGYDAQANLKAFEVTIEKMESATDMFELVTGYPIFDSLMGGVPKEGALLTWPGKPFHGKSILIDNFIVNLLRLNPNLQIMLHHVDDAALLRVLPGHLRLQEREIRLHSFRADKFQGAFFGMNLADGEIGDPIVCHTSSRLKTRLQWWS
jgi:hypothetical protein